MSSSSVQNTLAFFVTMFCMAEFCAGKMNNILMEGNARLFPQLSHAIFDSEEMMNTTSVHNGIKDVLSDSFKFGLYTYAVLTLHIILLITLIIFAITGTAAYICTIVNCRHFFTGKGDTSPQSRQPSFSPYFNTRNDLDSWDAMKPVAQSLQLNYDRYNDGVVENY